MACLKDTRIVTVRTFFGYYYLFYVVFAQENVTMRKYLKELCYLF